MAIADLLQSEEFQKLPIDQQHAYLKENSQAFNSYSGKDQGTILFNAKKEHMEKRETGWNESNNKPEDKGFIPTIASDAVNLAVGTALPWLQSGNPLQGNIEEGKKALSSQYSPMERFGHGLAAMIPFIGPQAAQAGEELGSGQYRQGSAHAVEALLPSLIGAGRGFSPETGLGNKFVNTTRGVAKGAYEGARDAKLYHPFISGFLGEQLGGSISPELRAPGFMAGAMGGKILGGVKGAIEGGKEGFKGPVDIPEGLKRSIDTEPSKPNPNISKQFKVQESKGSRGEQERAYKDPRVSGTEEEAPEDTRFVKNPNVQRQLNRKASGDISGDPTKAKAYKDPNVKGEDYEETPEDKRRVSMARRVKQRGSWSEKPSEPEQPTIESDKPEDKTTLELYKVKSPLDKSWRSGIDDSRKFPVEEKKYSQKEIEDLQAPAREAKEHRLARALYNQGHDVESVTKLTNEQKKAISKDAGVRVPRDNQSWEGARRKLANLQVGNPANRGLLPQKVTESSELSKNAQDLLSKVTQPAGTVELRQQVPHLSKQEFDSAALELIKAKKAHPMFHADPNNATTAEKEQLIYDPIGQWDQYSTKQGMKPAYYTGLIPKEK